MLQSQVVSFKTLTLRQRSKKDVAAAIFFQSPWSITFNNGFKLNNLFYRFCPSSSLADQRSHFTIGRVTAFRIEGLISLFCAHIGMKLTRDRRLTCHGHEGGLCLLIYLLFSTSRYRYRFGPNGLPQHFRIKFAIGAWRQRQFGHFSSSNYLPKFITN